MSQDDPSDPMFTPEQLAVCLEVLRAAGELPGDHEHVLALERASARLRKQARKKRRQDRKRERRQHDRQLLAQAALVSGSEDAPDEEPAPDAVLAGELERPRSCYICKKPYRRVHHFYHQLCVECAARNWKERQLGCDLSGRRVLITGGRIKIGFELARMMLRDGAQVTVTTRFPRDAARRFAELEEFGTWRDRLVIHGLDLRDVPQVIAFAQKMVREDSLNALIHNAAQTVARPPAYYRELAAGEREPAPSALQGQVHDALEATEPDSLLSDFHQLCVRSEPDELFPEEALDYEGKPLDLRQVHSWRQLLHEVPPAEVLSNWLVGAFAPYLLNAVFREALEQSPLPDRYIVHVSAVEGQFAYENKTPHHPHTNMTKAALNMMTRTSGADYARSGIYMTSVDTGWITDENAEGKRAELRELGFHPPLDVVDGAARVYDPIVRGVSRSEFLHSVFLKDYEPSPW